MIKTKCPNCGGKLEVSRLVCTECRAEYPISDGLTPYDYLNDAQLGFLEVFLRCKGNLKSVGETLNMSYPTVKKRIDELLLSLGYAEKSENKEEYIMPNINVKTISGNKASEIIQRKLYEAGGSVVIPQLGGKPCRIIFAKDKNSFTSDKLNNYRISYNFSIFDVVVDLLRESPNHRAPKGLGRGAEDKVGYGKCTEDTVVGAVAIRHLGKKIGDSTYDPVFILAAVLEWAGIAENQRGYIQLIDGSVGE